MLCSGLSSHTGSVLQRKKHLPGWISWRTAKGLVDWGGLLCPVVTVSCWTEMSPAWSPPRCLGQEQETQSREAEQALGHWSHWITGSQGSELEGISKLSSFQCQVAQVAQKDQGRGWRGLPALRCDLVSCRGQCVALQKNQKAPRQTSHTCQLVFQRGTESACSGVHSELQSSGTKSESRN